MSRLWVSATHSARVGLLRARRLGSRAPRVAFAGGHSHANLGDDAMGEVARALLAPAVLQDFHGGSLERRLGGLGLSGPAFFRGFVLGGIRVVCEK